MPFAVFDEDEVSLILGVLEVDGQGMIGDDLFEGGQAHSVHHVAAGNSAHDHHVSGHDGDGAGQVMDLFVQIGGGTLLVQ